MAEPNKPVIMSEEPGNVRINIADPKKPQMAGSGGKMIKKEQIF